MSCSATRTGRRGFRDLLREADHSATSAGLSLFDARSSARAVRATLDEAEVALRRTEFRGWEEPCEVGVGRSKGPTVSRAVRAEAEEPPKEAREPESSRTQALTLVEMTGLEPVACTLRTGPGQTPTFFSLFRLRPKIISEGRFRRNRVPAASDVFRL
jgi:hypothetical protein